MKNTHEKPSLDDVLHVVDGRTGRVLTPGEYEQRQRNRVNAWLSLRYVKGPIPVPWLAKAFSLTPSAVKCAIALFYQRGLSRSNEFKIEPARFRELEIQDIARRRGLNDLEQAGLIRLEKRTSKTPIAKLIGLVENHKNKEKSE
jgi:hypothetical protein